MSQSGFVFRIVPRREDRVPEALESGQLIIGWAKAEELLDASLTWEQFRDIVQKAYYSEYPTLQQAGAAAGHLWRFIREMKPGDLVVVPYKNREFFVAEVSCPAIYDATKVGEDSAYRRACRWHNGGKPLPRRQARPALLLRMRTRRTSADATDLLDDIRACLG